MASDRNLVIQGLIQLHLDGKGGTDAVATMKSILGQAKEVETAVGGFGKETEKATKQLGFLDSAFTKLGATVAAYFAAGVIKNFLVDSYVGFARTERQALSVETQIKSLGQAAKGAGFRDFIHQLSDTSGFLDDDLVPAFQRALLVFSDYDAAQQALTLASKFAAAGIGDVGSNVDKLTRFFQSGTTRSLIEFGIATKGSADGTISLSEGLQLIQDKLATLPGKLDDAQSRINFLRNALDALKDSLGQNIEGFSKFADETSKALGDQATGALRAFAGPQGELDAEAKKRADELEQARVDAFFNSESQLESLTRIAQARDKELAQKAEKDKADAALKIEQDRLSAVADMNLANDQALLRARIELEREGSKERIDLELALLETERQKAIEAAKKIKADISKIGPIFDFRAQQILSTFKPEEAAKTPAGVDPEAIKAEMEKIRKATLDADRELLELRRDATIEGTVERIRAEQEIELAAFDARLAAAIASEGLKEKQRTELVQRGAAARAAIETANNLAIARFTQLTAKQQASTYLQATGVITAAVAQSFRANKAAAAANAIVNTAEAITEAIPNWYLVAAIAIAGALQLRTILATNLGSSAPASASAAPPQTASQPTTAAVAPANESSLNSLAGRTSSTQQQQTQPTVYINQAFGDTKSMVKLAREITRVNGNNQAVLR